MQQLNKYSWMKNRDRWHTEPDDCWCWQAALTLNFIYYICHSNHDLIFPVWHNPSPLRCRLRFVTNVEHFLEYKKTFFYFSTRSIKIPKKPHREGNEGKTIFNVSGEKNYKISFSNFHGKNHKNLFHMKMCCMAKFVQLGLSQLDLSSKTAPRCTISNPFSSSPTIARC